LILKKFYYQKNIYSPSAKYSKMPNST